MAKAYHHLTYEQRCQIYVLLKSSNSQNQISALIGVAQSTISREIRRNSGKRGYRYKQAQSRATSRRIHASSGAKKFLPEIQVFVESMLKTRQWSPEQISGRMKREFNESVSHELIYQHIWRDKHKGGTLYKQLRCRGKKYNKRGNKLAGRGLIPNRVGIEHRPEIVEAKVRVGDFEIDTIVGKEHVGAILSVVDRKTKLTFLQLLPRNTASHASRALISSLELIKNNVKTLTADNGKEFAYHQEFAEKLDAKVYFARPYHSWERGLNENTNRLVRQYFPKGTSFATLTQSDVAKAQYLLNSRPRKTLNYMTPMEVFFQLTGKDLNYALRG